jgi:hypothetical protein
LELALPWKALAKYNPGRATPPRDGEQWRIDFSRVEWRHEIVDGKYVKVPKEKSPEDNWVWSPTGIVDMHRPERWGYVQFSTAPAGSVKFMPDPTLTARDTLMEAYHYQKDFFAANKRWAATLGELKLEHNLATIRIVDGGYDASIPTSLPGGKKGMAHCREDSRIWVEE